MVNIKRALKIVDSISLDQRLSSYSVLLNKLIEAIFSMGPNMKCLAMLLINEILVKAHAQDPEHSNPLWSLVSALYIKSLLFPLTSKTLYLPKTNLPQNWIQPNYYFVKMKNSPFFMIIVKFSIHF